MSRQVKGVANRLDRLKYLSTSKRFYAFLICVAISTAIWLLIALSKNYTTVVQFPVRYTNLPAHQVVTNNLPGYVSLEVRSYGFQLLSYKLFGAAPIVIDVSNYESKPIGNIYSSYVLTHNLLAGISDQFSGETTVSRIWPDTIFMNFSDMMEQQFEVKALLGLTFKESYKQHGTVEINPASVTVSGPVSVLDTMQFLYTNLVVMENVSEDITKYIDFTISDVKDVSFSDKLVAVTVPVDEFTEGTVDVDVIAINVPVGYDYKVFPSQVKIYYNVGMKDFDFIDANQFQAAVELPDSSEWESQVEFQVYLTKHPDEVQVINLEPQQVEVILREATSKPE